MEFPRFALLILPYTRLELPGWGFLYELFRAGGRHNDALWTRAPSRLIRHKTSGYRIRVNLADWSERYTYFLGRHYDLALQLLMAHALEPGDRFVDVGANVGAITLAGAALVGARGRVDSFEPNPSCRERIRESIELNGILHVEVHPYGLSDGSGTLVLSVITEHSGMATLAVPKGEQLELVSDAFKVEVRAGDELLLRHDQPVKLVKIDVEGFELRALQGLRESIETWRPAVVTEMQKDWLARAGTSRNAIFQFMAALGYAPYGLTTVRRLLRHRLALRPIRDEDVETAPYEDFVWLHAASAAAPSLQACIA